jgi:hypothetical protein
MGFFQGGIQKMSNNGSVPKMLKRAGKIGDEYNCDGVFFRQKSGKLPFMKIGLTQYCAPTSPKPINPGNKHYLSDHHLVYSIEVLFSAMPNPIYSFRRLSITEIPGYSDRLKPVHVLKGRILGKFFTTAFHAIAHPKYSVTLRYEGIFFVKRRGFNL